MIYAVCEHCGHSFEVNDEFDFKHSHYCDQCREHHVFRKLNTWGFVYNAFKTVGKNM